MIALTNRAGTILAAGPEPNELALVKAVRHMREVFGHKREPLMPVIALFARKFWDEVQSASTLLICVIGSIVTLPASIAMPIAVAAPTVFCPAPVAIAASPIPITIPMPVMDVRAAPMPITAIPVT